MHFNSGNLLKVLSITFSRIGSVVHPSHLLVCQCGTALFRDYLVFILSGIFIINEFMVHCSLFTPKKDRNLLVTLYKGNSETYVTCKLTLKTFLLDMLKKNFKKNMMKLQLKRRIYYTSLILIQIIIFIKN